MMQIDMTALGRLLAKRDVNLAEHPDLVAQVMALNEQLAATPDFTPGVMMSLLMAMLQTSEDEHS